MVVVDVVIVGVFPLSSLPTQFIRPTAINEFPSYYCGGMVWLWLGWRGGAGWLRVWHQLERMARLVWAC